MKSRIATICAMSIALATLGTAQTNTSSAGSGTQYTQAQLKQLTKDAHTPAQYGVLAGYYGSQQKQYLAKAADEKQEWARRSANIMLTAAKYPRPVDSAHYLCDYYTYKAAEAGQLAAKYSQSAGPDAAAPIK
jgi:hypothetical protein